MRKTTLVKQNLSQSMRFNTHMFSFSQYLQVNQKGSRAPSKAEIFCLLPGWIGQLKHFVRRLSQKNIIHQEMHVSAEGILDNWMSEPTRLLDGGVSIERIDGIYQRFLVWLNSAVSLNTTKINIPGGYPFLGNQSGVVVRGRLVLEEDHESNTLNTLDMKDAFSFVGDHYTYSEKKKKLAHLKKNIGKIEWLTSGLVNLGKNIDSYLNEPHAEMLWFLDNHEILNNYLKSDQAELFANLPLLNDDFPLTQLLGMPRLEFILSDSCCFDCRVLFTVYRQYLESQNIHIPIVLYADNAYNNSPDYLEPFGSVYALDSNGRFCNTNVQCNTPRTHELKTKAKIALPIMDKHQNDLSKLIIIGSIALLDLIKIGTEQHHLGSINPITYVAPDTLIIFAAEMYLKKPNLPPSYRRMIVDLYSTLSNIDLMLLTWWRTVFTEYLHWILIFGVHQSLTAEQIYQTLNRPLIGSGSTLAPQLRTNLARATNLFFPLDDPDGSSRERARFQRGFLRLWQQPRKLLELYDYALEFFTEKSHMRMPFGVMAGPLSIKMIQRDESFTQDEKNLLLEGRMRDLPTELIEDSGTAISDTKSPKQGK